MIDIGRSRVRCKSSDQNILIQSADRVRSRDRFLLHLTKFSNYNQILANVVATRLPIHFPLYTEPKGSSRIAAMLFGRAFKKMVNLQSEVHLRHWCNLRASDQIEILNVISDIVRAMGRCKSPNHKAKVLMKTLTTWSRD